MGASGAGVHALGRRPHVGASGAECADVRAPYNTNVYAWFRRLSERLRYVRVVCGDWSRVCGGNWQDNAPPVGIFLDPPYSIEDRDQGIYQVESRTVAQEVVTWALGRGDRQSYRIVVAGYEGEHTRLDAASWCRHQWNATGGYGKLARSGDNTRGLDNRHRECLWFSPHCQNDDAPTQLTLEES